MEELTAIQQSRAFALAELKKDDNIKVISEYAHVGKPIAVFGVYPNGVGYAGVIAGYLSSVERDVTIHTYSKSDSFKKSEVEGSKILIVTESPMINGVEDIGKKALEIVTKNYIELDDFRLLIVNPFRMLKIEDMIPNFKEFYENLKS